MLLLDKLPRHRNNEPLNCLATLTETRIWNTVSGKLHNKRRNIDYFLLYSKCSYSTYIKCLSTCGLYKPYNLTNSPCSLLLVEDTVTAYHKHSAHAHGEGVGS